MEIRRKRFYLQDEELRSRDGDFFRHEDLAANVEHIIKDVDAPYNIAVIGKWGLGKSSLINMALSGIRNLEHDYLCVYINAWKYEKEVLSRVFLRQVMSRLQPNEDNEQEKTKKSIFKSLNQILRNSTAEMGGFKDSLKNFISRYWCWGTAYIVASLILYCLYRCMMFYLNPVDPVQVPEMYYVYSVLSGYLRNSATLLLAPAFLFLLTNVALDFKNNPLHRVGFQLPEIKVEDYERELGVLIDRKLKENPSFKIIITLDDLDRLSPDKMVEALDAIKMFINFRNCIFIVPFDDSILKTAINNNRFSEIGNHNIYEGEQLLDKLFQYKIYLMPQLGYDIKKYARTLCLEQLNDFFVEYCDKQLFIKALDRIIIHYDVSTPRQVKKLVNTFISYMMLARRRESEGKVPQGFATTEKGVFTIAKLSVLQADYNDFYDLLFDKPDLIDDILEYQKTLNMDDETKGKDADKFSDIEKDVIGIAKNGGFLPKAESLLNFLHSTRNFGRDNLSAYLYVTEDDIARVTGAKDQRDFIKAASSGNSDTCLNLLRNNEKLSLVAEECIKSSNDGVAIAGILSAVTMVYKTIPEDYIIKLANAISDRADDVIDIWEVYEIEGIESEGLLSLYEASEGKESFERLIDYYIGVVRDIENIKKDLTAYFGKMKILPKKTMALLNEYVLKAIISQRIGYKDMIEIRRTYALTDVPWMNIYYRYIIDGINENADYSNNSFLELRYIYEIESENNTEKAFQELRPLFNKPWATEILTEMIKKDRDRLSNSIVCDLIMQQIASKDENDEKINELLTAYDYEFTEAEDFSALDKYLTAQISNNKIYDLLKVYGDKNPIKNISGTVNTLINNAFKKHDEIFVDCAKMIIQLDEGDYLPAILQNISNFTATSKTNYSGVADIMSAYATKKPDDIIARINTLIMQMGANSGSKPTIIDEYYLFILKFFENEKGNENFSALLKTFIAAVISRIKAKLNIEAGIKVLISLSDDIKDDVFLNVEPTLYGICSDVNIVKDLYILFEKKKNLFGYNDGQIDIKHLIDVCLNAIEKTTLKNEAIQTLGNTVHYMDDVAKFALLIQSDGIEIEKAYPLCGKFIDEKLRSESYAVLAVHDICEIIDRDGIEFIEKLFISPVGTVLKATETVIRKSDEFAYNEVQSIASWISVNISDNKVNEYIDEVIAILATEVDNNNDGVKLLDIIERIPEKLFSRKKDKYIHVFVDLVTKGFGEEFNEKLMVLAKNRRIFKDVIAQAPDRMSEELGRYSKKK